VRRATSSLTTALQAPASRASAATRLTTAVALQIQRFVRLAFESEGFLTVCLLEAGADAGTDASADAVADATADAVADASANAGVRRRGAQLQLVQRDALCAVQQRLHDDRRRSVVRAAHSSALAGSNACTCKCTLDLRALVDTVYRSCSVPTSRVRRCRQAARVQRSARLRARVQRRQR
jgi:hypothetical protein